MRRKMVCDDRTLREVANEFLEQSENSLDVDVLTIEILEFFADIPTTSPERYNHPYQYLSHECRSRSGKVAFARFLERPFGRIL